MCLLGVHLAYFHLIQLLVLKRISVQCHGHWIPINFFSERFDALLFMDKESKWMRTDRTWRIVAIRQVRYMKMYYDVYQLALLLTWHLLSSSSVRHNFYFCSNLLKQVVVFLCLILIYVVLFMADSSFQQC